jgi:nitroreductase
MLRPTEGEVRESLMDTPFDVSETDRLLMTTRSVRKRLDLERRVPREVIEECLTVALQAPTAVNSQRWRWLVVTDPGKRAEIARLYNDTARAHLESAVVAAPDPTTRRVYESSLHLCDVLHRVPVHVIPCIQGRLEEVPNPAAFFGSVLPAAWSFMLALRSRGLGATWTTGHLYKEKEVADLFGIPFDSVTQVGLLPVAYTVGSEFQVAARLPVADVTYWDTWGSTT